MQRGRSVGAQGQIVPGQKKGEIMVNGNQQMGGDDDGRRQLTTGTPFPTRLRPKPLARLRETLREREGERFEICGETVRFSCCRRRGAGAVSGRGRASGRDRGRARRLHRPPARPQGGERTPASGVCFFAFDTTSSFKKPPQHRVALGKKTIVAFEKEEERVEFPSLQTQARRRRTRCSLGAGAARAWTSSRTRPASRESLKPLQPSRAAPRRL